MNERVVVDIERVIVRGPVGARLDAAELGPLVEAAIVRQLRNTPLPRSRAVRAGVSVAVPASTVRGAGAVADAIGGGIATAISGGRARG